MRGQPRAKGPVAAAVTPSGPVADFAALRWPGLQVDDSFQQMANQLSVVELEVGSMP